MHRWDRLSLNQITTRGWSLPEAIDGCTRAGITAIGLWRDKIAEVGLDAAVALVRDSGLRVSSVCQPHLVDDRDKKERTNYGDRLWGNPQQQALDFTNFFSGE